MRDSSRSAVQLPGNSKLLGRSLYLLSAVGFAAALGAVAFTQSEPTHQEAVTSAVDMQAMVVAANIGAVCEQVLGKVNFDQTMQKASSIVAFDPAHPLVTAVVVGTGLAALSPLGSGLMHLATIYTATQVFVPDVVKFISL